MGGGGSALRVCADHRGGINWLSLSPDGQRLLTGSEDGTARLWSTADGQCCALLQGHESYVTFCQLEDEAAFTCSADCTIRRWDVLTGQCLQVYRGHTSIVNRLKTLHPQKLFNPGQDERVVLPYLLPRPLPTAPGELLWGCWRDPSGASKLGPCCRILVANNQLFSSSYDRTARVWSVDKGQMSQEFRGHRNCMLTLAYSAPWDLPSTPCVEEAAAGGLLVTGSTDGTAKVWQVASGCCHQTLRGHTGAVLCLVLDTPSHTAFTGSTDATIRAWDILSGEQLRVFREHQGSVICLELVNRLVYSGSADRTVKCWLADTGECVRTFTAHRRNVSALKYHAGTLFTGSGDACARAFDAQSGELRRVFRGHTFIINCIQPTASPVTPAPAPAGARPGALHRLARRRLAPLGRARAPRCPAAPSAHAQPLAPLQQQSGLRRRAPAAGLIPRGPCRHQPRRPAAPRAPRPATRGGGARWPGRSEEARAGGEPGAGVWFFFGGQEALGAGVLVLGTAPFSLLGWLLSSLPIPDLAKGLVPGTLPPQGLQADCPSFPSPTKLGLSC
ncbi:WD repeat-containing protein 86 isoform X2 [Pongo abelii]|uniref:WD repeat-containing protein 86 isoform X2 n=1 Tax=Pongo abelii TaxID=9601 RepID=UPI0023E8B5AF|nr:WD repeat-containing protein 86 isoform X2 [Pongo abelii]